MQEFDTSSDEANIRYNRRFYGKKRGQSKYFVVKKSHLYVLLFIAALIVVILLKNSLTKKNVVNKKKEIVRVNAPKKYSKNCNIVVYCHDVLNTAIKGRWEKTSYNQVFPWKQESVGEIRRKLNLPVNMTRTDGRCGIHFPIPNTRLAAHCDAAQDAELPCCAEASGWCGSTNDHCQHEKSFDMRKYLPPQRVQWKPMNEQCKIRTFEMMDACSILADKAKKIVFLGDSQARHFFTAFVLFLTHNYNNGAINAKHHHDDEIMQNCTQEYQLLNNDCRHYLVTSSKQVNGLCNGQKFKFQLEYFADYQSFVMKKTARKYESMYLSEDSYIVIGAATHFNSDKNSYMNYFLKYIIEEQKKTSYVWPKYIVETLHDVYSPASTKKRQELNEAIRTYGEERDTAVLDNSRLSRNLESFDGRTYGLKYNLLKVQILLNYFHNQRECT
ncbi:uncharacterized protein LOC130653608 isoform X1 [Hydractinia symbiolongicarpus]|uniref:uncharacterized protein LOC130653608 isoform X1 n=1 Tax=Hydractinia symbiolongicarpus TaxID=13093 RepID=UPI002551A4E1|nr:uncharacterized protein LOC130653608 isoform X1 [Hydractinia symbiolongicarpus]